MTAQEQLIALILDALDRREVVPCVVDPDGGLWVSDRPVDRREAEQLCDGCPVIDACDIAAPEAGARSSWGVWAGRDRAPQPQPPGRPRKTTEASS